ncbi:MAG: aminopeptidase P family protein, partial [Oscillospiraceae bacterium]|nr:aminopeptidase P family protein [Oscillospiraceae bacterium]
ENGATATVIPGLDSIAWLLNMRAADIPGSPVFISFLYVSGSSAALFTESSRLPKEIAENLSAAAIEIHPYEALTDFVAAIPTEEKLFCDPSALNGAVFSAIRSNPNLSVVNGKDLVTLMKACKNPCEIKNQHQAYLREGCAFAEFFAELFENLEKGETPTEYELRCRLAALRREQKGCLGDSFGGIFAYRDNAAIVHYSPAEVGSAAVLPEHMLLVDSGGQFVDGTTDTTRTVALGATTDEERRDFTLVLKGHIAIATAIFPEGTTGKNIDSLCRANLWKYGLYYRHGTGHGVGYLLNVHEGPQSFSANVELKEGMVITNEPGFYKEGSHGIRTESVYYVTEAFVTEYGRFLRFECFTVFPIDNTCVDFSLLTAEETEWLRNYNKTSIEKLLPLVSKRAQSWLKRYLF